MLRYISFCMVVMFSTISLTQASGQLINNVSTTGVKAISQCSKVTKIVTNGSLLIGGFIPEIKKNVAIKCASKTALISNLKLDENNSLNVKFDLLILGQDKVSETAPYYSTIDQVCLTVSGSELGVLRYEELVCE